MKATNEEEDEYHSKEASEGASTPSPRRPRRTGNHPLLGQDRKLRSWTHSKSFLLTREMNRLDQGLKETVTTKKKAATPRFKKKRGGRMEKEALEIF